MPEISRFFGIVIRLHFGDHHPPHFHAGYQGSNVEIDIRTLAVLEGHIANRALGLVMEWASLHQSEILAAWERAASGTPPGHIAPLS